MSIASEFREKWAAIMNASDASRGRDVDERYAAMAKAADEAGYALVRRDLAIVRRDAMKHSETCPCTECT